MSSQERESQKAIIASINLQKKGSPPKDLKENQKSGHASKASSRKTSKQTSSELGLQGDSKKLGVLTTASASY